MGQTLEAVVFLMILCVSVSFCQDLLGTRILEERSFQDALSKVENLLEHLDDIKIKDVKGKSGDVSYELTKITDVGTPVPDVEFVDGFRNINAKLTLSPLTAEANWWARYKNWLMRCEKKLEMFEPNTTKSPADRFLVAGLVTYRSKKPSFIQKMGKHDRSIILNPK